ncbi:VanZ family protein [Polluticoccus soli]|uniref:VanZ family protein n=1 Tax=Polluticoccus soli TaxID=3034150 RepID=UPI0023E2E8B7|nr:VanZ family protein [Flavipsychrobacter sp. JY13-12]
MSKIFSQDSPYKNRARWLAIAWTLLIFILCFLPGRDLPDVDIPFIDKWVHLVLFGAFSFLWLCSTPTRNIHFLIPLFTITVFLGWLVEYIQGHYVVGRTQDNMDTFADSIGGLIGILIFALLFYINERRS